MTVLLLVGALGLMSLPPLLWKAGRRLPPDEWLRFCAIAVFGGAVILEVALGLCSIPALARLPAIGSWFGSDHERHFFPGGEAVGWVSLSAAVLLPIAGSVGWLRARRQQKQSWVEPSVGHHSSETDFELVVLPTASIVAIAVPGPIPQVVISSGLLDTLTAEEARIVIRHEAAHLRSRHSLYLLAAAALDYAFSALPPVRRSLATLRLAVECSADHAATSSSHERSLIRRALLCLTHTGSRLGVPAFGMPNSVLARLQVLENAPAHAPPGRLRAVVYTSLFALMLLSVASLLLWAQAG